MNSKTLLNRSATGYSLIEVMVSLVIVGILTAAALPNFLGAQEKAKTASVKGNMRAAQVAAESFAADNNGTYPDDVTDAYKTFFPGGDCGGSAAGKLGVPPLNPFTNARDWPVTFGLAAGSIADERALPPSSSGLAGKSQGTVGYVGFGVSPTGVNSYAYAVEGTDAAKNSVSGRTPNTTLVLSNL